MPPVAMTPSSAAIGRAVCRMRSRIWATVQVGWSDSTRAATPATCGLAIDVPLLYPYPDGSVLRITSPGAAMSTPIAPTFENWASWSSWSVAATEMMFGRS